MTDDPLLTALLANPIVVAVGAASDGTISHWSSGAEELYGWAAEEVLGRPLRQLLPPGREHELQLIQRLVSGEVLPPFETVRLHRDGSLLEVELRLTLVRDAAGEVLGTLALHRDLGRARRAEAALSARNEELRAGFAGSPVPQALVDLTGRVVAANDALGRMLGVPVEELVGQDGLGMYVPGDRAGLEAALERMSSGQESVVREERTLRRPDGGEVPIVLTVTTTTGPDGMPLLAASAEDVRALRAAEDRVRRHAATYRALVSSMPVAVFTYDRSGVCAASHGAALSHLGLEDDELVGVDLRELYRRDEHASTAFTQSLRGEAGTVRNEVRGRHWEAHYRPLRDAGGAVVGGIGIAIDVTERATAEREVRANEARLRALLREAEDVVLVVDDTGRLVYVSPSVQRVLGHDDRQLFWRPARAMTHPDDIGVVAAAWAEVRERAAAQAGFTVRLRHADGSWRWCEHVMTNRLDDPDVGGVVVNLRDVTERRRAEAELSRLALHDSLTGLANRALLLDRVTQALVWSKRDQDQVGLLMLEVSSMARTNEEAGHAAGDAVLRAVAERLRGAVRDTDSAARASGCHFAVLVEDVASEEDLRARATALVEAVHDPVEHEGTLLPVEVRLAMAMTPAPDAGALLSAAERALVEAAVKPAPVPVLRASLPTAGSLREVAELRQAVTSGQLCLHYQPVVHLHDGSMAGVEALVRWEHPERGLLPPAEFVPLAERSDLILELGEWVLREACHQSAVWQAAGHDIGLGINLSPRQLVDDLPELVRAVLRETGAQPDKLVLEVTESALMDDPGTVGVLDRLRDLGLRLALDDFGTGYSSLTYLKLFPVDAIKIDRSFVAGLGRDPDDEAIVTSVVSLAHATGKIVVAEGVETPAQQAALTELGVEQAQGYLWSPALAAPAVEAWYLTNRQRAVPLPRPEVVAPAVSGPAPAAATDHVATRRVLEMHEEGASLHTIAAALNAEGLRTAAGPRWTTTTVARVIALHLRPGGRAPA